MTVKPLALLAAVLSTACAAGDGRRPSDCASDAGCTVADGGIPTCDEGTRWNGERCEPDGTCRPDCAGRACGADGCGGTCGECDAGNRCDSGACVPDATPCPEHSHAEGDACVCDEGYLSLEACGRCVPDGGGGCPENAFATEGGCQCVAGYGVSADGCGCQPAGTVAAPCASDAECAGECLHSLSDFEHSSYATELTGGYCSLPACGYCADAECTTTYCEMWGGVCVEVFTEYPSAGDRMHACLAPCADASQCRPGLACRTLSEEDPELVEPNGTFCLPPR